MCASTHEVSNIRHVLLDTYNIEALSITRLTGYDDINYAIEARLTGDSEHTKYILKIVNALDSARQDLTESIMTVLQNIPTMKQSTPKPIQSKNGNLVEYTSITGTCRKVVLLTYLDGLSFKDLQLSKTNFLHLCRNIGSCAGTLASELNQLSKCIRPLPLRPDDIYMIENLHLSRDKLHVILNDTVKQISSQIMDIIENIPKAQIPLRKRLIHNDICFENMIFYTTKDGKYEVQGVIDFSDMTFGYFIFDAAIPIASCMYQAYFMHETRDLLAAQLVLSEFERCSPLTLAEHNFLFHAVMARLVSLRVLGGYDVLHSPETAQHEDHESKPLDHLIERLWSMGKHEFNEKVFNKAVAPSGMTFDK